MSGHEVDFLVIGAQKSGTTTAHRWLEAHPEVYVPSQKELRFFTGPEYEERGFEWYCRTHFSEAAGRVAGEASPHYMIFERAAPRIARHLPGVKLIALLRDPAERAFSHYRMGVQRSGETRSFDEAVDSLILRGHAPDDALVLTRDYVQIGEYGRILAGYLDHFPRAQLLVVAFEELTTHPGRVAERIFGFLGVDPAFESDVIGRAFNTSGRVRSERLVRAVGWLSRQEWLKRPLRRSLFPQGFARLKQTLLAELNVARDDVPRMSVRARERLRAHYAPDVARLVELTGFVPPWPGYGVG